MIKCFILLLSSTIIYIKNEICETFKDCSTCISNYNCNWNLNQCETNIEENNEEWWTLFSKCGESHNNIYCGLSKIDDLGNQVQTLSLEKINEGYGDSGILCSYYFEHKKNKNKLRIEYSIKSTLYNIAYPKISMKFYFNNSTSSIIDLTSNKIFNEKKIKKVEIYVLCYEKYYYNPFLIRFLSKNNNKITSSSMIFILLGIIALIIVIICILNVICSKQNKEINEIRNENDIGNFDIISLNGRKESFNKIIINEFFKNSIKEVYNSDLIEKKNKNEKCSICLESFQQENNTIKIINKENKNKIVMTSCKHYFHYKCLYAWLCQSNENVKCPNCNFLLINREEIEKIILNYHNTGTHNNLSSNISNSINSTPESRNNLRFSSNTILGLN